MMVGLVNENIEAVLPLNIRGPGGREVEVQAVLDTGFSGNLTLPSPLVDVLSLSYYGQAEARLGDGTTVVLEKYSGITTWDGREREIIILMADGDPLIGMALLHGNRLTIEVVEGGRVLAEVLG